MLLEVEKDIVDNMNKKIVDKLVEKYNLPKPIIEKVISSQFKFTADIIASGTLTPVRHPNLGVFAVKPGRKEKLNK